MARKAFAGCVLLSVLAPVLMAQQKPLMVAITVQGDAGPVVNALKARIGASSRYSLVSKGAGSPLVPVQVSVQCVTLTKSPPRVSFRPLVR